MDKIKIYSKEAKEKFENWIRERGGVAIWETVNLSNSGASPVYTPALREDGQRTDRPHWSVDSEPSRTIADINQFRFLKDIKEVARFRVGIRFGGQGCVLKCTDASSARIRRTQEKHPESVYEFDYSTQEVVFYQPVWED